MGTEPALRPVSWFSSQSPFLAPELAGADRNQAPNANACPAVSCRGSLRERSIHRTTSPVLLVFRGPHLPA